MSNKLDELVTDYGQTDAKMKELKKVCDSEKESIKMLLTEQGETNWTAGGYTVTKVEQERITMDQEQLLQVLKVDWLKRYGSIDCPYIKTREYVDMDELEAVLYAGELPKDTLQKLNECQSKQTVVTLRCTKAKEKKA